MKRLLALAFCAFGVACAITACGGGGDETVPTEDKLTVVGSGT